MLRVLRRASRATTCRRVTVVVLLIVGAALAGVTVAGQFGRGVGRWAGPRFPDPERSSRTFTFCRVMYESVRREYGGYGWSTDYPTSDANFMIRLSELTKTEVAHDEHGEPDHVVVRLTDEALFEYPFIFMSDAGTAAFSDEEAERLGAYLKRGGFLWVDDFWGPRAWDHWTAELRRALPASEHPIVDIPLSHPLFRGLYSIEEIPQIPSIQFWRRSGGSTTSERGYQSSRPHFRGIADAHGRLMVFMSHNTDIADGWEREAEDEEYFHLFSVDAYAVGINVLLYAMTH